MSQPLVSIVQGWTGPIRLTAVTGDNDEPYDLTGLITSVVIRDCDGTIVKDTADGVTVTDSTAGAWQYEPSSSSGDLFVATATPYRIRLQVMDALGKVEYFPSDEAALIEVNER